MSRIGWIVSLGIVGCGGNGAVVDAEGCDALEAAAFEAVTAGAGPDGSAPAITADSGGYTVTLPASGPGFLAFDSPDDTEYIVFADREVSVAAFFPDGTEVMAQARATSIDACEIVHRRDVIELPVGAFFFTLGPGPDPSPTVDVVLRPFSPD